MTINKLLFLILLLLIGCRCDHKEINSFSKGFITDYTVDEGEINCEHLGDYIVESIKINEIDNNNVGKIEQLKNQYLLFINDSMYIHVSPDHPKNNLDIILNLFAKYKTDSTYLQEFEKNNNEITVTINKKRIELFKSWYAGDTITETRIDFYPWKDIYYRKENRQWKIFKVQYNYFWPDKDK